MVLSDAEQTKRVSSSGTRFNRGNNVCLWYRGGAYINFDLAWPSSSIPDSFFPSNVTLYGESLDCLRGFGRTHN